MSDDNQLASHLRHMLAVLDAERQALAGLDLDALLAATLAKQEICASLEAMVESAASGECRTMLETAKRQNEVNRRVRNLLSANLATRLDNLRHRPGLYHLR